MTFVNEIVIPIFTTTFFLALTIAICFLVYKHSHIRDIAYKLNPNQEIIKEIIETSKLPEKERLNVSGMKMKLVLDGICTHKDFGQITYYYKKKIGGEKHGNKRDGESNGKTKEKTKRKQGRKTVKGIIKNITKSRSTTK